MHKCTLCRKLTLREWARDMYSTVVKFQVSMQGVILEAKLVLDQTCSTGTRERGRLVAHKKRTLWSQVIHHRYTTSHADWYNGTMQHTVEVIQSYNYRYNDV